MTLIINEIHTNIGLSDTFQIAAADRRITRNGFFDSNREKILPIKYLNATVSYFGLASFIKNDEEIFLNEWLKNFIKKNSKISSLEEFSKKLQCTLNDEIDSNILKNNGSGFHISGYTAEDLPDFWHFSNIDGMNGWAYGNPLPKYQEPKSHFLGRDAQKISSTGGVQIYRNGDIRTHVIAFEKLDTIFKEILNLPDFKKIKNIEDYAKYVKYKFEIIASIYKQWSNNEIIGKPIDIFILQKDKLKKIK